MPQSLTPTPARITTTSQRRMATHDASYQRLVISPTRLYWRLSATGMVSGLTSMFLLISLIVGWVGNFIWLGVAMALSGLAMACFWSVREHAELHRRYLGLAVEERHSNISEHAAINEVRQIPMNHVEVLTMKRPSKTLGKFAVHGAWLDSQVSAIDSGAKRLTRANSGTSGSKWPVLRELYKTNGLIDDAQYFTEKGLEWIQGID